MRLNEYCFYQGEEQREGVEDPGIKAHTEVMDSRGMTPGGPQKAVY